MGKNYLKQVDVIMTDWATGPELLISTKRMDSSYGKNAANRVEESYGDAKNLRLRHPLAALGFVFGLRSDILEKEPDTAEWLIDLLGKLGREDDAYHATCLVMIEYADWFAPSNQEIENDSTPPAMVAGPQPGEDEKVQFVELTEPDIELALRNLPPVVVRSETVPDHLKPSTFLEKMVKRVLDATPVNMHKFARQRLANPRTSIDRSAGDEISEA
jgi:hypothetical protein